ncbi:MAG TPA: hypothetical protein VLD39_05115, partial [Gammaproteobacteria bacterium]|nr:hypothetical protein [Gammaproteobacteria bacterium]
GALFAAPTVVVRDLEAHYDVAAVMRIAELKEQFFVIAPGAASELGVVQAVIESAREQLRARARTPAPLEPVGTGASGAGAGSERVVNQASIRVASLAQSPRNRSRWNGVTASPVDSINAE